MDYLAEFEHLRNSMPREALGQVMNENSDFCNYIDGCKDCYLLTNAMQSEKCMYGRRIFYCDYCIDCDFMEKCELCYQSLDCKNCYNCDYCQDCENCSDGKYLYNCKGCRNCFGCVNLRQKEYHIFNKHYPKEEYFRKLEEIKDTTDQLAQLKLSMPHDETIAENNINSTGDHIFNNKNVQYCFDSENNQDCAYSHELFDCEDCLDITIGEFSKWNYDCTSTYKLHNSNFCYNCWESSDLEYCDQCRSCEHCLFCSNLLHKKYYIFNKPSEKEEYFKKKSRIISKMKAAGRYGDHISSTYPFEDTLAS